MNKEKWMRRALDLGIESFEIYQSISKNKEVTWYQGQMDTFVSSVVNGTSIRGIVDGNMANLALEVVDDASMDIVLQGLIEQAKLVSTQEKDQLRKPEPFEAVTSDVKWVKPSMEALASCFQQVESKCLQYDPRIVQVANLVWQEAYGQREITNTLGLHVQDADQAQYFAVALVASENGQSKIEQEIEIIHDLNDFDIDVFVKKLCDKVLARLGSTSLQSQKTPVILEKGAMTDLLSAFMGMFNGELIHKGISPIAKSLNESIFSSLITLVDDPRCKEALSIASFDDEGCPTRKKVLVDRGVFKTILHDTKSAMRMQAESTGNGFKSGYASGVSVHPMNAYIQPGTRSLDDLCETMQNGLVITDLQGLHAGINFVSADFSLQCEGYWVKDGKRAQSVSLITIADNFLELMKKVIEVGNDLEWSYHQVVSPSILFKDCSISGE